MPSMSAVEGSVNAAAQPQAKHIGVFGTLGLAWLYVSNKAIGGAEIEFKGDGIELMSGQNIDSALINEMLQAGAELDAKYFSDKSNDPHIRYASAVALFYMVNGRINKIREWWTAHRKETKKE